MKKTLLIIASIFLPYILFSQVKISRNNFSVSPYKNEAGFELGGNCLFYSIYYQRALFHKNNLLFNIRVGGSLIPSFNGSFTEPTSPLRKGVYILPNVLFPKRKHAWELGLGFNAIFSFDKVITVDPYNNAVQEYKDNFHVFLISPQVGYRVYLKNDKFYFRTAVMLYTLVGSYHSEDDDLDVEPKVLPWAGFGFGYRFGKSR